MPGDRFVDPWILLYLSIFFFIKFYNKHHKFTLKQSLFCYWVRQAYICSPFYFWLHPFLKILLQKWRHRWVIWNEPIGLSLGQPTRRNKENKTSVRSNLKSLVKYKKQIITSKEKYIMDHPQIIHKSKCQKNVWELKKWLKMTEKYFKILEA